MVEHCEETGDEQGVKGAGLAKVQVRLLYTFDHELPLARKLVRVAVNNGTLETALARQVPDAYVPPSLLTHACSHPSAA